MNDRPYLIEACVESSAEAIRAINSGADQIELCRDLSQDGLTPSLDQVRLCLQSISQPVKVMIRPIGGGFQVDHATLTKMKAEIKELRTIGVQHFVFGITTASNRLDLRSTEQLIEAIHPLTVTIHKAIDTCAHPVQEAKRLRELGGIAQILTSGGAPTALDGASIIRSMIDAVGDQIDIIAAGSITNENLISIHQIINAPIYHGKKIVGPLD